jgi:Zn finger protein HypA/HybF involved in hydrogenase expression
MRLSKEIVNQRISHRGIELIGEYTRNSIKTLFKCSHNHTWLAKPNNVMSVKQSGCPHCAGQFPLTKDIVNLRIKHKNLKLIDEYLGIDRKTKFQCLCCNTEFVAVPYNIITKSYCPNCHKKGGGFNIHKSATFYIILFPTLNCIKYGITNNLNQRMARHNRSANCEILYTKDFLVGKDAFLLEQNIKSKFGGNFIGKDLLKDGYTETLPKELLQHLLELI